MGSLATAGGQAIPSITKLRVDHYAFTLLPHDAAHNRRYERRHQPTHPLARGQVIRPERGHR